MFFELYFFASCGHRRVASGGASTILGRRRWRVTGSTDGKPRTIDGVGSHDLTPRVPAAMALLLWVPAATVLLLRAPMAPALLLGY
jgi:hypothetical protein